MPTRMRELEEYGDVEKKTRDAAPGVELHQLRAREEDADVFARAPARVDAVDRSSSRSSGCVERAAAAAAASASMTSTLTACKKKEKSKERGGRSEKMSNEMRKREKHMT